MNHDEWVKQLEAQRLKADADDKRNFRLAVLVVSPFVLFGVFLFFATMYMALPTIIKKLIEATAQWHALFH